MTSTVSRVPVPGVFVNHLAMDDTSLYWTTAGGGSIFRYPFSSPKNSAGTILAQTDFAQGMLSAYPGPSLFRAGGWLIFDDRQFINHTTSWTLRAFQVGDDAEQKIAQGQNPEILFSFATDGEWVVWITGGLSTGTVVTAQNLQTGDRRELAHSDSLQTEWEQVAVSAGRAAAIQLGGGRSLFLFDLISGQSQKLLTLTADSDMDGLSFDGNWIAWKTGTNFQGPTALYNLQTAATEILPDWGYQTVLVGRWLAWEAASEQPLYAVDLESGQGYLVAEAQPGDELGSPVILGDRIAWRRMHTYASDRSKVDSSVEWRALP